MGPETVAEEYQCDAENSVSDGVVEFDEVTAAEYALKSFEDQIRLNLHWDSDHAYDVGIEEFHGVEEYVIGHGDDIPGMHQFLCHPSHPSHHHLCC